MGAFNSFTTPAIVPKGGGTAVAHTFSAIKRDINYGHWLESNPATEEIDATKLEVFSKELPKAGSMGVHQVDIKLALPYVVSGGTTSSGYPAPDVVNDLGRLNVQIFLPAATPEAFREHMRAHLSWIATQAMFDDLFTKGVVPF
jgi:hypothetical protein